MQKNNRLVLLGGTLIDGNGGLPVPNSTVIVKDNKIEWIGSAGQSDLPEDAHVVRLNGASILPGLIDSHVHLGTSGGGLADPEEFKPATLRANLKTFLSFGVTTIMDMAAQPILSEIQKDIDSGEALGPRLFGVRYGITAPDSHPMGLMRELGATGKIGSHFIEVDSVAEARAAVRRAAAEKPDGLKIYHSRTEFPGTMCLDCNRDKLKPDVLAALIDEGKLQGLKIFAHIAYPSEAREVILAGADVLTHPVTHAETGFDEVCEMMVARGVAMHTTLTRMEAYFGLKVDPFMREKLIGRVAPAVLRSIGLPKSVTFARHNMSGVTADARRILEITMANIRRATKAGVTIAMGTDSGGPGAVHGAGVPREMELMNESGMTPMQVIVAATRTAAEVIGQTDKIGTLQVGKLADIIIVDGDPIRNISDIRKVRLVVKNGRVLEAHELVIPEPEPVAKGTNTPLPINPLFQAR
ncbi:MAG: amidohydrolase [Rhizobium sp.]|nr:amidohydrolase [Rhizobium sp.]